MLLSEKAEKLGKQPVMMLAHYHVLDYDNFNAERLTINTLLDAELVNKTDFSKGLEILS